MLVLRGSSFHAPTPTCSTAASRRRRDPFPIRATDTADPGSLWYLRTLFIAVTVLGAVLGIAGHKLHSFLHQKQLADSLASNGAAISIGWATLLGFRTRAGVLGQAAPITPDHIEEINQLKHLESLDFSSPTFRTICSRRCTIWMLSHGCTLIALTSQAMASRISMGSPVCQIISVLMMQLDGDTEEKLRRRYPNIYIEKLHLIHGRRVVDGYQ